LFQAVVPFFVQASESVSNPPVVKDAPHAELTLGALTATSLCGSLCLVASLFAVNISWRRHQRSLLRC
jgi:hypothetical protein